MNMLIAVTSPIAGLTILTVFASQTTLVNHIRTTIVSCYNLKYQTSYILYLYVMQCTTVPCILVQGTIILFSTSVYVRCLYLAL